MKAEGLINKKEASQKYRMYIDQIIEYLIWPGFILIAWFCVNFAVTAWEKKNLEEESSFSEKQ